MSQEPLKIVKFEVGGPMGSNAYLIIDEPTKEAVIIDPGSDEPQLVNYLKDNGLKLKKIILTHGHYDHIGGVQTLRDQTGAEVIISEGDKDFLVEPSLNLSSDLGGSIKLEPADRIVKEGDQIEVAPGQFVTVMETPGHTPGSISLVGDNYVIVGDVLFQGSIGRTDFRGGDLGQMIESLRKLMELPDETAVLPGHGDITTIGQERQFNPFIRQYL